MRNLIILFALITLVHSLLFVAFWLTNQAYYREVNRFLTEMLGKPLEYVTIFVVFSLLILAGSLALILLASRTSRASSGLPLLFWLSAGVTILFVVFFYGSFWMLFRESPVQLARLGQLYGYFRLVPDAALLLVLAWVVGHWLAPTLAGWLGQTGTRILCAGILLLCWSLPVFKLPGNVYRADLPGKPLLVAHRGAAWLAPENTVAAMLRAVEIGVFGLEADVHLSLDGVLFLNHDASLKRTTDVGDFYPDRIEDQASLFTWEELSQLNAGAWFTSQDPYGTIAAGLSSTEQAAVYKKEALPRLQEILDIVAQSGKVFLFDLYDPPQGHPYRGQALRYSLEAVKAANLGERAWMLASLAEIPQVKQALPGATLVAGIDSSHPPAPESLLVQGYQVVNSEYSLPDHLILAYRQAGLWVNIYTVDEPWQFSRLWLQGIDSATSNNVHNLSSLDRPVFALKFGWYLAAWVLSGLLAAGILWFSLHR